MGEKIYNIENHEKYLLWQPLVEKLTAAQSPELMEKLNDIEGKGIKNIILDLEKVNYCDSSALSFILNTDRITKNLNGCTVICNLQKEVKKLIEISKLDTILNLTPSLNEAIDYLYMDELEKGLGDFDEDGLN